MKYDFTRDGERVFSIEIITRKVPKLTYFAVTDSNGTTRFVDDINELAWIIEKIGNETNGS